jgi:predicted  nucleic acid-binding Zn-ribbon protein
MNADLERLIALQRLDTDARDAERRLADAPEREKALDARLEAARQRVGAAKERLAANQNARRTLEKDVAVHQGRLSKFREQAMAVKTNQEYHAIQHEMAFAQAEIKTREDQILELMVQADELTADVRHAEAALAAERSAVEVDRKSLAEELTALKVSLERMAGERKATVLGIRPEVLAIFDQVANRRGGVAVAEAREGICTICHVRMRPQIFNMVRRNDEIVQCEHCQRVLFFVPVATADVVANSGGADSSGNSKNNNAASSAAR